MLPRIEKQQVFQGGTTFFGRSGGKNKIHKSFLDRTDLDL
jgi:hypothetical protein